LKATNIGLSVLGAATGLVTLRAVRRRLDLSRAKHPGLVGHVRMAKRASGFIPQYAFGPDEFYTADGAPDDVVAQRRASFAQLAETYETRFPKSAALSREAANGIPDVDFTSTYRVPFQFSPLVKQHLYSGSFYEASEGVMLTDLDGNRFYDLTGSYGVNLLGVDAYRELVDEGIAATRELGPALAGLHPVVADNVSRLKAITGLDAVSFHMSGTEAVMQAVRLARYHTGKRRLVRFAGAYHGWWGDVQPGIGNPVPADNTLTLADMSDKTLKVLATRKDIACVLVNPLQFMHPNKNAPGDSTLVSGRQAANTERAAYSEWLQKLQATCREAGVVFIMDEVFSGFRLAPRGACEYFGVEPDMVTFGKTLGGGLPVGVVCGRADLMKRYREDKPADICFARGTFNSHPYVMGAMNAFLRYMETPEARALYEGVDECWNDRAASLNAKLATGGYPVHVVNLGTIWSVTFTRPGRYHWMLQFYLRAQGLALSWVGSGRLIFSLAYGDAEFAEVEACFLRAAEQMEAGGWWWDEGEDAGKNIRRRLIREMVSHFFA